MPERHLIVKVQSKRQTNGCNRLFRNGLLQLQDLLILPVEQVFCLALHLDAGTFFAAVSGNKPTAAGKADDIQVAVCRTTLTGCGRRLIGEMLQLFSVNQCGAAGGFLHGVDGSAKCSHQTGNSRTDNVPSHFPFKAP